MLIIKGLNTHYGASHILQGVDLEVPDGTYVTLVGTSVSLRIEATSASRGYRLISIRQPWSSVRCQWNVFSL